MINIDDKVLKELNIIYKDFLTKNLNNLAESNSNLENMANFDPFNLYSIFVKAYADYWKDPNKAIEHNMNLLNSYIELYDNVAQRAMSCEVNPIFPSAQGDRRFNDELWDKNPMYDFIHQSYNLNYEWCLSIVKQIESLSPKEAHKAEFYMRLLLEALAPTNFPATNPAVIREAIESKGQSIVDGTKNFLNDLRNSKKFLNITTIDDEHFEVGKNLAITEGAVIYKNDLMELIQYSPKTEKVFEYPLLLIPAWINKYYIMDLQPHNSLVSWLCEQGFTVFMVSWTNPNKDHANKNFADYMQEGIIEPMNQILSITKAKKINVAGYCLGGTLLAATLSYLKDHYKNNYPVASATFLTSLVDFEEAGDLSVFIDEEQLHALEKRICAKGYLEGSEMAQTFSMIRANDMIWSFYVNNYLMGKSPLPFDILYWNSDSTRLPAAVHTFYLRKMYLENLLAKPNKIKLKNTPIDLKKIDIPTYMVATEYDHIVPWKSAYKATQIYSGPIRFCLSGSGHVAGIINPPSKKKYGYQIAEKIEKTADKWLKNAKKYEGSWWNDWSKWLQNNSGIQLNARIIRKKDILDAAPGKYVLEK